MILQKQKRRQPQIISVFSLSAVSFFVYMDILFDLDVSWRIISLIIAEHNYLVSYHEKRRNRSSQRGFKMADGKRPKTKSIIILYNKFEECYS